MIHFYGYMSNKTILLAILKHLQHKITTSYVLRVYFNDLVPYQKYNCLVDFKKFILIGAFLQVYEIEQARL